METSKPASGKARKSSASGSGSNSNTPEREQPELGVGPVSSGTRSAQGSRSRQGSATSITEQPTTGGTGPPTNSDHQSVSGSGSVNSPIDNQEGSGDGTNTLNGYSDQEGSSEKGIVGTEGQPEEEEEVSDSLAQLPLPPGSATRKQLTTLPEEEIEEAREGEASEEAETRSRAEEPVSTPQSPQPTPRSSRSHNRLGVGWEIDLSEEKNDKNPQGNKNGVKKAAKVESVPSEGVSRKGGVASAKEGVASVDNNSMTMGLQQDQRIEGEIPPQNDTHPQQELDSGLGSPGEESASDVTIHSPRPEGGDGIYSPRPVAVVPHKGRSANSTGDKEKHNKTFSGKSTLSTRASTVSSAAVQSEADDEIDSINVVVRVRPLNPQEAQRKDKPAIEFPGNGGIFVDAGAQQKSFTFNVTFEPQATQEDVFDNCGVKKLVEMALDGYSCTAFAFGQTGSGKTHTITGPPELFAEGNKPEPELYGLIPRSFHYLFRMMNKRFGNTGMGYRLFASYMEIYNEQVIDLLNPNQRRPLAVRWSKNKGFYVENLFVLECETMDDIMAVLEEGLRNRATGSNSVNEHSSRSHSMLTLHIDSEVQDSEDENVFITKHGKLTFVDLAGSEKVKTEIQNTAGHLAESNNINKSLLVLGNCISALGDVKRRQGHIPYRDSKLTKLLADSLGGNGVTLMIACVSPASINATETLNTLRYANRAKKIKTKPAVKMDPREKLIMSLKREIKILRQENHYLRKQLEIPLERRPTALEFPVKPKGQLQKENDKRFLEMLRDHQESGGKGVTDHGLYEMLQEYMIENETLRTENSDLHTLRDTSRREQQTLARENEKLLRKLETMEKERMLMQTPLSIYSVGSSASRQTSASELNFERTPHNTPPAWGHGPPTMEYYGRDSTQGSWTGPAPGGGRQPMVRRHSVPVPAGSQALPHENGPHPSYTGPTRSRNPPAHLQHPMRPPHRLSEPVVKQNNPSSYMDSAQRGQGYMSRYYQQQDYYKESPQGPGPPPPQAMPPQRAQGWVQQPADYQRAYQPMPQQRSVNSYNQDHPVPTPRKSKGASPASQGSRGSYSKTNPTKKVAQKAPPPPPPPEPKESIEEMNERLKRELMDLEGAIKHETKYTPTVKANGYGGRR